MIVFESFEELRCFESERRSSLRATPNYRMPQLHYGGVPAFAGAYGGPEKFNDPKTEAELAKKGLITKRSRQGGVIYQPEYARKKAKGSISDNLEKNVMGELKDKVEKILRDRVAQKSGYEDDKQMQRVIKRHEIIHSIQSAKRGYKNRTKIREVLGDELGAYLREDKKMKLPKDGKFVRKVNKALGVAASTAHGIAKNPTLKRRLGRYLIGAAALGGGTLALKAVADRKKNSGENR